MPFQEVLHYFRTRILYCLTELQKQCDSDQSTTAPATVPDSVLTTIDMVVDLLDSHLEAQPPLPVDDLTDAVDGLLSQVLLFRTITMAEDQAKLLDMCRCVLAKKLQLRSNRDHPQMASLAVDDLRRCVVELEQLLNNCLLRLFVSVSVALDDDPLAKQQRPASTVDEAAFDLLMDRLIQLGIIAIGFTGSGSGMQSNPPYGPFRLMYHPALSLFQPN